MITETNDVTEQNPSVKKPSFWITANGSDCKAHWEDSTGHWKMPRSMSCMHVYTDRRSAICIPPRFSPALLLRRSPVHYNKITGYPGRKPEPLLSSRHESAGSVGQEKEQVGVSLPAAWRLRSRMLPFSQVWLLHSFHSSTPTPSVQHPGFSLKLSRLRLRYPPNGIRQNLWNQRRSAVENSPFTVRHIGGLSWLKLRRVYNTAICFANLCRLILLHI